MRSATAIIHTLILAGGLSAAMVCFAGDNEQGQEIADGEKTRATVDPKPAPAKKNDDAASRSSAPASRDSTFKPTEEISEDLSVPFPVDI